MSDYSDKLANLAAVMKARRKYDDDMLGSDRAQIQADADAERAKANAAAAEQGTDWFTPALTGTTAGATFGPWGALIGGAAGLGLGLTKAVATRTSQPGTSFWGSVGNTLTDYKPLTNMATRNPGAIVGAAGAVGGAMTQASKAAEQAKYTQALKDWRSQQSATTATPGVAPWRGPAAGQGASTGAAYSGLAPWQAPAVKTDSGYAAPSADGIGDYDALRYPYGRGNGIG